MRLLALLLWLARLLANINCTDVFGIVGNNFTFPTQIYHKVTNIVWTKNKHKVAEWEGQNKPTYFKPLENRSVLMENGSLTIFNLTKNDAGSYALWFMDSEGDVHLTFELVVHDSLTEPKIICNASDGKLVINCTADFPGPLDCILKFGDKQQSCQNPLSIPVEDVGTTSSAKCIVKSSQMERSSEIFLHQCLPEEKAVSSAVPIAIGVTVALALVIIVGIFFLKLKGKIPFGTRSQIAQNNNAENGSEELKQFVPGNGQQLPGSEGAFVALTPLKSTDGMCVQLRKDTALNGHDSVLKDKEIVKNGVSQKGTLEKNSSLLANHAGDHDTDN